MFRISMTVCISALLMACQQAPNVDAQQRAALQTEAASIVQQFAGTLKPQLIQALKEDGPAHAIEVCSGSAPALAKQLGKKTGWVIKRVSLKPRNHRSAVADAWETSVLEQFDSKLAAGVPATELTASRIENGQYHFMKAQAVMPVCLACHGKNISPDVADALKKYYPMDQATGYGVGQIRGAFSLIKQL